MTERPLSKVGLGAIGTCVPTGGIDLLAEDAAHAPSRAFITDKTGFRRVARKDAREDTSDLAEHALRDLLRKVPDVVARCQLLVVVTQNPDGYGLPHVSARLAGRLGMPTTVAAFDVGLGCSGWVYGLATVLSFMDMHGFDDGILVTADPYSKIIAAEDRDTLLLFGDAATALHLTRGEPTWRAGRFVFGTDGAKGGALEVGKDRRLRMNGRAVFSFSATAVPDALADAMSRNGLAWADVDRVVLHQGSRFIVETIGSRIGQPDKTPFLAADYGNAVSSSIPLILAQGHCDADRCVLVAGFGVGLSWAVTALLRSGRDGSQPGLVEGAGRGSP